MATTTTIIGHYATGLTFHSEDGRPATLAIIDADGNVIEDGQAVSDEIWHVVLECIRNHWRGQGWIKVTSPAPRHQPTETAEDLRRELAA